MAGSGGKKLIAAFAVVSFLVLLNMLRTPPPESRKSPPSLLQSNEVEGELKAAQLQRLIDLEVAGNITANEYLHMKAIIMNQPQHHAGGSALTEMPVKTSPASTSSSPSSAVSIRADSTAGTAGTATHAFVHVYDKSSTSGAESKKLERTVVREQQPALPTESMSHFAAVPRASFSGANDGTNVPGASKRADDTIARSGQGALRRKVDTAPPPPREIPTTKWKGSPDEIKKMPWRSTWSDDAKPGTTLPDDAAAGGGSDAKQMVPAESREIQLRLDQGLVHHHAALAAQKHLFEHHSAVGRTPSEAGHSSEEVSAAAPPPPLPPPPLPPPPPRSRQTKNSIRDSSAKGLVRFLLVSQPRMGSTWVGSKIASHPCSNWRGETGMSSWSGKPGGTPRPCHLANSTKATDSCLDTYFSQKQSSVTHDQPCTLKPAVRLVGGKVWGSNMLPKVGPNRDRARGAKRGEGRNIVSDIGKNGDGAGGANRDEDGNQALNIGKKPGKTRARGKKNNKQKKKNKKVRPGNRRLLEVATDKATSGRDVVGEKRISPKTLAYMRRRSVHVVWVMRTNVLDRQISNQFVKSSNSGFVMHCFVNGSKWKEAQQANTKTMSAEQLKKMKNPCAERPDIQVQINPDDVLEDLRREKLLFKQLAAGFGIPTSGSRYQMHRSNSAGFPVLYVPYENLVADTSLWYDIAEFLGLPRDEGRLFQDRTKKRVTKTQRQIIENYEEVAAALKASGCSNLLTEP